MSWLEVAVTPRYLLAPEIFSYFTFEIFSHHFLTGRSRVGLVAGGPLVVESALGGDLILLRVEAVGDGVGEEVGEDPGEVGLVGRTVLLDPLVVALEEGHVVVHRVHQVLQGLLMLEGTHVVLLKIFTTR